MDELAGKLDGWSLTALLFAWASVWAVPIAVAQDRSDYANHVVVVQFAPDVFIANKSGATGLQEFDGRAAQYGVYLIERVYPFLDHVQPTPKTRRNLMALRRTYYVRYHTSAIPEHVAGDLAAAPGVVYAEPVLINRTLAPRTWASVDPDDPGFSQQTYLTHLRLPEAWDVVKSQSRTPRVVIAVVDGGGEWRHEDLLANVWTNPGEVAGNGVDDDGNGFIDDVHGVNFANGDDTDNDPTGLPETPGSALHGTAAAGAANAVTDNYVGVAGAAWNADLMHINAGCADRDLICFGYQGILYAAANGADIINASWGSLAGNDASFRFIDETLNLVTDMGALVVASAGNGARSNDVFPYFPARHPRVLSVGATEKDSRTREGISNYGKLVNVFAPGVGILTTGSGNGYVNGSGTSFSSPLTAGVASLVKTRFPDLTPDALREQVRLSSEGMDAENPGLAGQLGRGFVNAWAAVQAPTLPGVRFKRGSWIDDDGNGEIASGDVVTVTATVVNYLADAHQLRVGLVVAEPYSFIDMVTSEVNVGRLASGESTEVIFKFLVTTDAPANWYVRFFMRTREGGHVDEADMLSFRVNRIEVVHRSLSALYRATDGDNWHNTTNWQFTTLPSEEELASWYGVRMTAGWLTELQLHENNLTGMLPPELGNFTWLQALYLQGNTLTGAIPSALGNLTRLQELRLNENSLAGVIPSALGKLTRLQELRLNDNFLAGAIPSALGKLTQLQVLLLNDNFLAGAIPSELGNLTQLQWLYLQGNTLTGAVPSALGNLTRLQALRLNENSLTGVIPTELGNLTGLQELRLNENSLSGAIPSELGDLAQLEWLYLHGNTLTGAIPSAIGSLTRLKQLTLSDNALTGMLPRSLMQLDSLEVFIFGGQDLCAPRDDEFQAWLSSIPTRSGSTCRALQLAGDVSDKAFTKGEAVAALVLPEASGGVAPYTFMLEPALPAGLVFHEFLRLISGVPTAVATAAPYTYSVTDNDGSSASLTFTIEVASAVSFLDTVADQSFPRTQPIAPLVLPVANGGVAPIAYTLTPTLPAGLSYDSSTRTISGTPTVVTTTPTPYTYKATDVNGSTDSLLFSVEVFSPVAAERDVLPESFTVHGNYPNPFFHSTRLVFDLPWPARVTVEIMDMTGRRVLTVPVTRLIAGWEQSIELSGTALPSGLYMYRLIATSLEGRSTHVGRFVRLR